MCVCICTYISIYTYINVEIHHYHVRFILRNVGLVQHLKINQCNLLINWLDEKKLDDHFIKCNNKKST